MVYAYYDKKTEQLTIATNLLSIVDISGIKYHTLRYWFRNGTDEKKTDDYIIWRKDIVKSKNAKEKGSKKTVKQSSKRPDPEPKDSGDLFDEILKRDV